MPESTEKIVLRPGDFDFDARKLRDLEITVALGVEVSGGRYDPSSRAYTFKTEGAEPFQ